jgi:hypothetical protein
MRAATLVLLIGALTACSAGMPKTQSEKLQEAVYEYNRALRWNNIDAAAAYLPRADRPAFVAEHKRGDTVIMGADVLDVSPDYDQGVAEVTVVYEWRAPDGITVTATRIRQLWRYEVNAWVLGSRQEVKGAPTERRDPASRF